MSTILEQMRKMDLENAVSRSEFRNPEYKRDPAKTYFSNPEFKKDPSRIYFGNSLAISDVSKKYIEKFKAADAGAAGQAAGDSTSILKALRQRNMDAATKKM